MTSAVACWVRFVAATIFATAGIRAARKAMR